ncbi:nucleoprotein [Zahedan rhabdovirus]|uniref:Nucleoprotein n=1 Tax=Zahedan rhabdovirus TaxID=1620507 RepID=A0A0R6BY30_9RHAB|nr:nucleoprotein [Zahedan rhabdovirus]AJR16764.1 nucleoprotein [Zahedan rhabdovirus]
MVRVTPIDPAKRNVAVFSHDTTSGQPVVYPSVWGNLEGHPKPRVHVFDKTAVQAYTLLMQDFRQHQWKDPVICTFMCQVIREWPEVFQVRCTEAWTSYQRVIGNAGEDISPLNILDVHNLQNPPDDPEAMESTRERRLSLFYAILCIYRKSLGREITPQYRERINGILHTYFVTPTVGMNRDDINLVAEFTVTSSLTEGYKKIIAAIDMFFFKYPTAPRSGMRVATMPSRYRGCTVLNAVGQIARRLGIPATHMGVYILTEQAADEYFQVFAEGHGADDIRGYFPYQTDLELTTKSPYSMSANPNLHFTLHAAGYFMGVPRSAMARLPKELMSEEDMIKNAAGLAVTLIKNSKLSMRMTVDGVEVADQFHARQAALLQGGNEIPAAGAHAAIRTGIHEIRATRIIEYIEENDGVDEDDKPALREHMERNGNLPEGTIGHHLRNHFRQ